MFGGWAVDLYAGRLPQSKVVEATGPSAHSAMTSQTYWVFVRAFVSLSSLLSDKSEVRSDPSTRAKDQADAAVLVRVVQCL